MVQFEDLLVALVLELARRQGYSCRLLEPDLAVFAGDSGHLEVPLAELRQMVADEPGERWRVVVANYLGGQADPPDVSDFGAVRGILRARVCASESQANGVVRREVAPGLAQDVLLDDVHTVRPVTREMVRAWAVDEQDVFAAAERNVRGDPPLEVDRPEMGGAAAGLPISMLSGSEYTTAHLSWLGDYPVTGSAGTLLIAPTERLLFTYPIEQAPVVRALTVLAQIALGVHAEQPWPVSRFVYLWRDGRVELAATTERSGGGLNLIPTRDFAEFLSTLD